MGAFPQIDVLPSISRHHTYGSQETSWALRWTLRQEMTWLLELCGFQPVEQWSDFHGAPPACGKEQIWVARAA